MKDAAVPPFPTTTPTITAIARAIYNSRTDATEWRVTPETFNKIRAEASTVNLGWDEKPVVIHGVTIKPFGAD